MSNRYHRRPRSHEEDQYDAAISEARAGFHRVAASFSTPTAGTGGEWAEVAVDRFQSAARAGAAGVCPHMGSPVGAVIEAWNPTTAACVECVALRGWRPLGPVGEVTCDGCGAVGDHIHWATAAIGPFLVLGGVCCDCLAAGGGICTGRAAR